MEEQKFTCTAKHTEYVLVWYTDRKVRNLPTNVNFTTYNVTILVHVVHVMISDE
jgi:hypothetical protein